MVAATAGALLIPTAFATLRQLGASRTAAAVPAVLLLADTALAVQSRLILLDAPLVLAIAATTLAWAHFRWSAPGARTRWLALLATGLGLGVALSIKWVGLFVTVLVGAGTVRDLWTLVGDRRVSARAFAGHFAVRAACLIAVPVALYVGIFVLHLRRLDLPGPGDYFLPPPLLASLRAASPASPRVPADIVYGSEIMLQHRPTTTTAAPLMLHSHAMHYPAGSRLQQVTASLFRDTNSWWIVRPHLATAATAIDAVAAAAVAVPVPRKAYVRLQHRLTQAYLHASAGHAAPLSPSLYEVAALGPGNGTAPESDPSTLWVVELGEETVPGAGTDGVVHAWSSVLQLRHASTGCILVSRTGVQLPEWGARQQEVGCRPPRSAKESTTAKTGGVGSSGSSTSQAASSSSTAPSAEEGQWVIDNHVNRRAGPDAPVAQRPRLSLARMVWEFQVLMWTSNESLVGWHPYQSAPTQWPWLVRGIGYWVKDHAQIYFVGNPAVWLGGLGALAAFVAASAAVHVLAQRHVPVFARLPELAAADAAGWFLVGGWVLHYLPFFLMKRNLFVHHYLPALYFSVLLVGVLFDAVTRRWPRVLALGAAGAVVAPAVTYFVRFYPLVVGDRIDADACAQLAYRESWRLLC